MNKDIVTTIFSQYCLGIADINISIKANTDNWKFEVFNQYLDFVRDLKSRKPDVDIVAHYGKIPEYKLNNPIFYEKSLKLSFYQNSRGYILKSPSRLMVLDQTLSSGDIYIKRPSPIVFRYYPLQHPLDKILMLNLLASRQGAMVHSCGVDYGGNGLLFVGTSGAGKSTMAKLWDKNHDVLKDKVVILNDDRVIVRKIGNCIWLYGTPWHGDARLYSPAGAVLKKILFIKHSKCNSLKEIKPLEAISRLLGHSLAAFWDKKNLECSLDLYAALVKKIPCYELGFIPDKSVLDYIKNKI